MEGLLSRKSALSYMSLRTSGCRMTQCTHEVHNKEITRAMLVILVANHECASEKCNPEALETLRAVTCGI